MANRLGMTEQQMIEEIEFMRRFEKYLMRELGIEHYNMLCHSYAREKSAEALREWGATEEEIERICDKVDEEMDYSTKKQ